MLRDLLLLTILLPAAAAPLAAHAPAHRPGRPATRAVASIPAGHYLPLYAAGKKPVAVRAFTLDRYPVTRGDYLAFVRSHPEWRRGTADPRLAGAAYLAGWRGPLDPGSPTDLRRPVTEVSWHAADAYCKAQGKRLPTTAEWEYAAAASPTQRDASHDAGFKAKLLALYTRPRPAQPEPVGSTFRNAFGVSDMHGLVWEWVADVGGSMAGHDHAAHGPTGADMACAGGALQATDPGNYAGFLRYAFRSSLTRGSTTTNLGFRCAGGA